MKRISSITVIMITLLIVSFATMAAAQQSKKLVGMTAHITQGVTCDDCHATDNVMDSCLACHANSDGTYRGELDQNGIGIEKEYPESRKTKMAAMHDSHGGKIRCTVCHTSHKEPSVLYCNHCHQFDVKIK